MAEDLGERTEMPTPRRLSEARGQGNIARSPDFSAAIDLTGVLILLIVFGGGLAAGFAAIMRRALEGLGTTVTFDAVKPLLSSAALDTARAVGPILILVILVAALAQYLQVGANFTTQPLLPKFEKLNPVKGFMNLFSRRNLVKSVVNMVKLCVVLGVSYLFLSGVVKQLSALPTFTAFAGIAVILRLGVKLAIWLLAILLVIGVADLVYQRWQHKQDLKMSKADVKDERRAMEGDPHVKSQRFRLAQKIAMQRINSAVPKADVVVTNPTHYSVAIQYDQATMKAPRVVAKGADLMALRVRQIAMIHGIPIVERPPLARALYAGVEVGREIQPEHYQAVAEILAFVYKLEKEAA